MGRDIIDFFRHPLESWDKQETALTEKPQAHRIATLLSIGTILYATIDKIEWSVKKKILDTGYHFVYFTIQKCV